MGKILPSLGFVPGHSKVIAALVVGLGVGVGSAAVWAAIPDSNGVIHACYHTSKGDVRIIDSPSQACTNKETAIQWNQTGPQGPAGSGGFVSDLVGANFSNASLVYADLRGQDLHGASFVGAIINGTDFTGANLSGVTIGAGSNTGSSGVIMPTAMNTVFQNANLSNSVISGGLITDANFNDANFTGALLNSKIFGSSDTLDLVNSTFQNANFHNASISTTDDEPGQVPQLRRGNFQGAILDGTTISMIFIQSNFHGVDFRDALIHPGTGFRGVDLANANFSGLTLDGTLFVGDGDANPAVATIVAGAIFTGSHFTSANLSGTDFSGAILTGATWSNTVCPDETNSNDHGNTCIGHLVP